MSIGEILILIVVGAIASAVNAVAGGGSLLSFPAVLIGARLPETIANATNSFSLWPGSVGAAVGSFNLFSKAGHYFKVLAVPTLLGSTTGAFLLLNTTDSTFKHLIPYLILVASLLLLLQPKVKQMVGHVATHVPTWIAVLIQFLVATYGGYFGAGMGIMMLASFALYMDGTIHELNAVKNWLGVLINVTCSVVFVVKGLVVWGPALCLMSGAVFGGYFAGKYSQKVDPDKMRLLIAAYGILMTGYFFYRAYGMK